MSRSSTLLKNASGYAAAYGAADTTTADMKKAIESWFDLYYHTDATEEEDPCQRIAYTVVRKLTKTVFSEYKATSDDAFVADVLYALRDCGDHLMQLTLIGGEALLKPIPEDNGKGFMFAVVPRDNVLVFARDAYGNITDLGTVEVSTVGNCYYTLLERRTVDANGYLTIRYKLFKSYAKNTLEQQVPLSSLQQYAQLQPEYTFTKPVGSIGMVRVKTPIVNCVDGSPDGVSIYAAAEGLIHNINRNEALLKGEFERGQSRIIASDDMLKKVDGKKELHDNLFVGLDEDPEAVGITIFSPTLREQSFLARKQEYLRAVESVIGLKRGLLSEVEAAERTATEITSSAGEYNLTVIDLQKMWEKAIQDAVQLCGILGQMYKIAAAHDVAEDAITFTWGNGVLYDEGKTYTELKEQVSMGLLQPERLVGWYHNVPCETLEERQYIRETYMPMVAGEE